MSSITTQSADSVLACDLEVAEFMRQMDDRSHSIFSCRPLCDGRTGPWLETLEKLNLNEVYSECRDANTSLMTRIHKYLEKSKLPPMNLAGNGDWDGVRSQMEKACTVLENILLRKKKRPGLIGSMRRGFDVLCRNAGMGKAFVSIIPDDLMVASAVSGSLNIIFVALEQHGIYEESIFNALEQLPDILNTTGKYSEIAVADKEIHYFTAKFYTRVCELLDCILRWMMENKLISGTKQVFQPNSYVKVLNEKLAGVQMAAKNLEYWAISLLLQSQKNLSSMQGQTDLKLGLQHQSLVKQINGRFDELSSKIERLEKLDHVTLMVFNRLQLVLNDEWHRIYRDHSVLRPSPKQLESLKLTADDVLDQLLFDPYLVPRDMETLLRQGTATLHQKLQPNRMQAIQENPRLRAWLSLDSASLLLVNGNSTSHLDLSTSFFSAKVMDTLMKQALQPHKDIEIIPLAYFCVQHKNYSEDMAAHPAELAMSLLLQLVDNHREFEPRLLRKCLEDTRPYGSTSILKSFARLLDALPSEAMVFIIIDGIEHFTRPEKRRRGLREVCFQLIKLFREQRGAKVKLLFTSAQKAVMIEELGLVMDNEVVNIPKSPPPRGQANDRNILIQL